MIEFKIEMAEFPVFNSVRELVEFMVNTDVEYVKSHNFLNAEFQGDPISIEVDEQLEEYNTYKVLSAVYEAEFYITLWCKESIRLCIDNAGTGKYLAVQLPAYVKDELTAEIEEVW